MLINPDYHPILELSTISLSKGSTISLSKGYGIKCTDSLTKKNQVIEEEEEEEPASLGTELQQPWP